MQFPVMLAATVAKKAFSMAEKRHQKKNAAGGIISQPKQPMSKANKVRLAAGFTATLIGIAFLLSILQVFAGTKPGMMDSYSVFTLNTSRIGEGLLHNMTDKIQSFNLSSLHKRDEFEVPAFVTLSAKDKGKVGLITAAAGILPLPTSALLSDLNGAASSALGLSTTAPAVATPLITSQPTISSRDLTSALQSLTSKAGGAVSSGEAAVSSKASSIEAAASSKVASAEAAASSAVNNALKNAEGKIVQVANSAYHGAIKELELEGWYAIYISSTCSGQYAFKNGTDAAVGAISEDAPEHKVVDHCSAHSAMNPLGVIKVLFWIGAVFTGLAFIASIAGIIRPANKKVALATVASLILAFAFLGLASAVTHGVAIAARNTVNSTFSALDIQASVGKAVQLAWATTCMVLIPAALWIGVKKWAGSAETEAHLKREGSPWAFASKKRQDRTSGIAMQYVSPVISAPMPAYDDRRTQAPVHPAFAQDERRTQQWI